RARRLRRALSRGEDPAEDDVGRAAHAPHRPSVAGGRPRARARSRHEVPRRVDLPAHRHRPALDRHASIPRPNAVARGIGPAHPARAAGDRCGRPRRRVARLARRRRDAEARPPAGETPKRGGTLTLRTWDPPHFDHVLAHAYKTHVVISFTHSRLLRHKAGPSVRPGSLQIEGDLAESWQQPNDTTYVFKLKKG